MKIKYLLIISLILAIISIAAVSASENLTDDSLQTVEEDNLLDECQSEEISNENSEILQDTESKDTLGDYYSGKVHIGVLSSVDLSKKYYVLGYVTDDDGISGKISVSIDGKNVFSKKFTKGDINYYSIDRDDMDLLDYGYGYHDVKITYNDGKAKSDSRKVNFVYKPTIRVPYVMAVGETNYVILKGASSMSGTATLYCRDVVGYGEFNQSIYKKGAALKTVKIKKGQAVIPLKILKDGDQSFVLEYKIGTCEGSYIFDVEVGTNTEGFASSISAKTIYAGKPVTLKLTGPKSSKYVNIYVDGKYLKEIRFSSGSLKEVISGLSEGTHYISLNLDHYGTKLFYSNTFKVTVISKVHLTLKKVDVKKSAKKLVLTSTLKIYKKPAKGKTVTFKFNGKTYKAKTNKKGIAKVTIKKAILKKLKVGKKIKIQAKYSTKTATNLVKVKK